MLAVCWRPLAESLVPSSLAQLAESEGATELAAVFVTDQGQLSCPSQNPCVMGLKLGISNDMGLTLYLRLLI